MENWKNRFTKRRINMTQPQPTQYQLDYTREAAKLGDLSYREECAIAHVNAIKAEKTKCLELMAAINKANMDELAAKNAPVDAPTSKEEAQTNGEKHEQSTL